jgi:hypothetical protein
MSEQSHKSDLLVELSTEDQELLTGGRWVYRCRWFWIVPGPGPYGPGPYGGGGGGGGGY